MIDNAKRWMAAAVVLTFAAFFLGVGYRLSMADEPKVADLADLRDAVQAASKRGDNVDEIAKALDAVQKIVEKGWKPEAGKTDPPAELNALRQAVEAAGRKGENVEEIRKQLDAVEMKLLGRQLTAPKAVVPPLGDTPPPEPRREFPRGRGFPNDFPRFQPRLDVMPFPVLPQGNINPEALQKGLEARLKAFELLMKNPNDPEAQKAMQQALEEMLKAVDDGRGGVLAPELLLEALGGRVPDRVRLGVRMEKLTPVVVEQLGLEAGRGISIVEVMPGTPAEKAGFKANDIVIEFAGKPVSDVPEDFTRQVNAVKAGEKIDAVVLRKGKKVELKGIELPEVAAPKPAPQLALPERLRPALPLPDLGPKLGGSGLSMTLNNGNFTIRSETDGVKYVLQGTIENGKAKLNEATIEADGKVTKAESLEKVPEAHRGAVERLLKSVGGGSTTKRRD